MLSLTKRVVLIGMGGLLLAACGGHHDDADSSPQALLEKKKQMDRRIDRVLSRLNATDAQRSQIHALKRELLRKAMPLRAARGKMAQKLRAEWASPQPDRQALHRAVDQQLELVKTLAHTAVDRAVDLHTILTPEQRAELLRLIDQLRQMHRFWHG